MDITFVNVAVICMLFVTKQTMMQLDYWLIKKLLSSSIIADLTTTSVGIVFIFIGTWGKRQTCKQVKFDFQNIFLLSDNKMQYFFHSN